ncbi:MAG: DUF1446 domain-containing protein, partial [Actinomycetota bacterium]|nr:DUF1446 domain-containing protein [Actinomycetota bacterium]
MRIGNCSGYYGDRASAARELLDGGPLDVLTGDYLAEVTMYVLAKVRSRGRPGYAATFLGQLEDVLGVALDRGVRIVTNAGGLEPARLAEEVERLAARLGLAPSVAYLDGDDLLPRLGELRRDGVTLAHLDDPTRDLPGEPLTANAYLGGWGIVAALDAGADVVVCPRVTDASLVVGPAAWWFGWPRDAWDALAGAVVAGHLVECGTQVTGGNYSFFREIPRRERLGFPVAEVAADGSCVVTKEPGSGGAVTVGTVTEQLLYEIGGPRYRNPDVVARFDTVTLHQAGADRVAVRGARGEPAPATLKVGCHYVAGHRNTATVLLTGLDIDDKAVDVERQLVDRLGDAAAAARLRTELRRTDTPDATSQEGMTARLVIT